MWTAVLVPLVHADQAKWLLMPDEGSIPSAYTLGQEFGELIGRPVATLGLARKMRETLSLHVLGGPEAPKTEQEAAARIDKLWTLLRDYIELSLEDEIANDCLVCEGKATADACATAAEIIFQLDERRTAEHWTLDGAEKLTTLQGEADKEIRKSPGHFKYFRNNFQYPILEVLARLLLKDEAEHRTQTQTADAEAKKPHRPGEDEKEEEKVGEGSPLPRARRSIRHRVAPLALVFAFALIALVLIRAGGGGSQEERVLAPQDLSVSLRAGIVHDRSGLTISPNPTVDLGTAGGVQEVGFHATVRPVRGLYGSIPTGLHLAVVIPRESLTNQALPSVYLERAGTLIQEVGQQVSDAVTISSRQADSVGLDIPSDFRIQVKHDGNPSWGNPRKLRAHQWLTCWELRCELHLPLAKYARDAGDAVRVSFQTRAFELSRGNGPLLVMDMEQRRLRDRVTTDGELQVSPGDRVLYSFYLANRGTAPARNVVARLALPPQARLIPGSIRETSSGVSTPSAVGDNFVNGGIKYSEFGAGGTAYFMALAEVRPTLLPRGEMYPYWLVKSDETRGTEYYDSVTTTSIGG